MGVDADDGLSRVVHGRVAGLEGRPVRGDGALNWVHHQCRGITQ